MLSRGHWYGPNKKEDLTPIPVLKQQLTTLTEIPSDSQVRTKNIQLFMESHAYRMISTGQSGQDFRQHIATTGNLNHALISLHRLDAMEPFNQLVKLLENDRKTIPVIDEQMKMIWDNLNTRQQLLGINVNQRTSVHPN